MCNYWRLNNILCIFLSVLLIFKSNGKNDNNFQWDPFELFNNQSNSNNYKLLEGQTLASDLLGGQQVYISMTTISSRIYGIAETIGSIIVGTVVPNHIYIFLSKNPHLLDEGITETAAMVELRKVSQLKRLYPNISVIFTDNVGPHRKLIPLLQHKWSEDCAIVTVDDHEIYYPTTLAGLLWYYVESGGDAIVSHRSRRMSLCNEGPPWRLSHYSGARKGLWPVAQLSIREQLILPTGFAGVLYRPKFFNDLIFDRNLINITKTGDDLMFRLVTLAKGIDVVTSCTQETIDPGFSCPPYPSSKLSKQVLRNIYYKNFSIASSVNQTLLNIFDKALENETTISLFKLRESKANNFNLRKKDKRKRESLASNYNFRGGNDIMWSEAINYLMKFKYFNFTSYLQEVIKYERSSCISNNLYSKIKQLYDNNCGMIKCIDNHN